MHDIVLCPACRADLSADRCAACGFEVAVHGGAIDLRVDKSFDTLLDVKDYDRHHGIESTANTKIFNAFRDFLDDLGIEAKGDVLEIACGSGNLTASMLVADCFDTVHCGDISIDFMERLSQRVDGIRSRTRVYKYLFDANSLPFADESVDLLFGNSVLHHFAEFERSLRDAFRVLRPGGAAVFGEPMLDGHAFVSLAAGIIARDPRAAQAAGMTSRHLRALNVVKGRTQKKKDNLHRERSELRNVEDKFQFPVRFLQELGADIGYCGTHVATAGPGFRLGTAIRQHISQVFRRLDLSVEPLDEFQHVFDALTEDYGSPMADYLFPLFSRIAFVK